MKTITIQIGNSDDKLNHSLKLVSLVGLNRDDRFAKRFFYEI